MVVVALAALVGAFYMRGKQRSATPGGPGVALGGHADDVIKARSLTGLAAYTTSEKAKAEAERLKGKVLMYEQIPSSRRPEKKKDASDPGTPRQGG